MKIKLFLAIAFLYLVFNLNAQITTNPAKPKSDETFEIIFDAGKGNKALFGMDEQVYYHAGLITSGSQTTTDWKFVYGEWGKADPDFVMESLGGDKYRLLINVKEKFQLDDEIRVFQLALVFRDAKGEKVGKTDHEEDFLIPMDGYVPASVVVDPLKYTQRRFESFQLQENALKVFSDHGSYKFQFYSQNILKVSYLPEGIMIHDTSISVIMKPEEVKTKLFEDDNSILWSYGKMQLKIQKEPFKISYYYESELLISEELGFFEKEKSSGIRFEMSEQEAIYGTGERAVPLNRRGYKLELFNRPDYNYGLNARNLNYGLPVLLSNRKYLLFIDNPQKGYLDIGESEKSIIEFGAIGGEMKYYIIAGHSHQDISASFTQLVGRQPLPPRWALGNLQSRMAYRTQKETESIVNQMIEKNYPLDAIILDFYWFGDSIKGGLGNLKWYEKNWPDPEKMILDFKKKGVKTVLITEPYVIDTSYWFEHGDTSQLFATNKAGETYVMKEFYFGHGALMDLFKTDTKDWFWNQYNKQIEIGVAGWWGDLGEPETHPEDMYHINGKAFEVHNMYAHEWAKMLSDKYEENYPETRLFHLNRSGATGTQRYSIFPWSGDVSRSWSGFQAQLPLMLNMSLCGLGYISSDLGGFALGEKDEELYTRWLQMGVFNPIFRPHGSGIPSEPIFFSEETQTIVRKSIKLRYRLMPYIYNASYENTVHGKPIVKPLFYYHGGDRFEDYSALYYYGDQLIVAPVVNKGELIKTIEMPDGPWYDFYTADYYEGGKAYDLEVTMDKIPVFVKGGSFIPMLNDYQSTDRYPDQILYIHYYPSEKNTISTYSLFEDDGTNAKNIEEGNYQITHFTASNEAEALYIHVNKEKTEFKYHKNERRMVWVLHHIDEFPNAVEIDGEKQFVYNVLQKPAIKNVDAKYDENTQTLYINMPWDKDAFSLKIMK